MITYFHDSSIQVNSNTIEVGGRSYPLSALDDVWLERGPWLAHRAAVLLLVRLLVAATAIGMVADVVALVTDPRQPASGHVPTWLAIGLLLVGPIALAVLIYLAGRVRAGGVRTMHLCARSQGRYVALYSTSNARHFGQVHRAVLRAMENVRL